ncbi:FAD-dependent oxidoreductase [Prolixibacteraceae bacterium JC049]|nr:FAD-dependent oxidoreductase [Prolixibacteraceae bacterium JC049]
MIQEGFKKSRDNRTLNMKVDLAVAGGGLSGVCAAVIAARQGMKVVLVQDRPVLGGNASSEVRLWALGTTSHMGNNNRWSRESGLISEILLENLKRNREGNAIIFDTILLEKVLEEKNITLLLNTAVYEVEKEGDRKIKGMTAFCSQNLTTYKIEAPYFCDATGDGIVSFLAGASFRMGAESADEFDEAFAPNVEDYGDLLGHSIYFSTKDVGQPVSYKAPSFAIKNAGELPRISNYEFNEHGCRLWWVEYGGRLDTIAQSEDIKMELWKVIYGIWDYVKNSGKYPEAANLTLEWVGTIPGKRESRRFDGDYMLNQKDIVEQRDYYDRVAYGGWAMDLHPADGIYSKHSSCSQWHSKGVYSIPYRCYYSKDLDNLFLAGRIISASHVAFGSSRIMLTCALGGQVVGVAAALCQKNQLTTRELSKTENIGELQVELNKIGHSIPRLDWADNGNLAQTAQLKVSSELKLEELRANGEWQKLVFSTAQLLPLAAQTKYTFKLNVKATAATQLNVQLMTSESAKHFTPDVVAEKHQFQLKEGVQEVEVVSNVLFEEDKYVYLAFMQNEDVEVALSDQLLTGAMTVQNKINKAVSNYGKQEPPVELGLDAFEFWTPERRPKGKNLAFSVSPAITAFSKENIQNNEIRQTSNGAANAWVAGFGEETSGLTMKWDEAKQVNHIRLFFDADYDHALECNHMQHPESEVPFVVNSYKVFDEKDQLIFEKEDNYQPINEIKLDNEISTKELRFEFSNSLETTPVSVFKIAVY